MIERLERLLCTAATFPKLAGFGRFRRPKQRRLLGRKQHNVAPTDCEVLETRALLSAVDVSTLDYDAWRDLTLAIDPVELATVSSVSEDASTIDSGQLDHEDMGWITDSETTSLIGLTDVFQNTAYRGSGYSVAVLDTGINYNHANLGGGWGNRVVAGYDFVNNDADPMDDHGHGTHVAGIVASDHGTYTGIAPQADLIALKVLGANGSGSFGYVEDALQWVIANRETYNIVAVNMSLGAGNYTTNPLSYLEDEFSTLANSGVFLAAASGNSFYSYGSVQGLGAPAISPNTVSVGAVWDANVGTVTWSSGAQDVTTAPDRITSFTQRSTGLDILAPGAFLTNTSYTGGFTSKGGTSMASPVVAGAAALLHEALIDTGQSHLANQDDILSLMQSTGVTLLDGDDENDNVSNTGLSFKRLDLFAAVNSVVASSNATPVLTPIADQSMALSADSISVTVNATDGDGDNLTYSAEALPSGAALAYQLDQTRGLFATQSDINGGYWVNTRGANEKYIRGTDNPWYIILPTGDLYSFQSNIASSPHVAKLDPAYYADPSLLYNAPMATAPAIGFSWSANQLAVNPPNGFVGNVDVRVTVSDGIASATDTFTVAVVNQAPQIDEISNRVINHSTDTITLAVNATDADGDSVSLTVAIADVNGVSPGAANLVGNQLTVDPALEFVGTFTVVVSGTDGIDTVTRSFDVTVTNQAPTLALIADQSMSLTDGARTLSLAGSDGDGDNLTYSVQLGPDPSSVLYNFDQTRGLYVTQAELDSGYWYNTRGANEKYMRGNDHGWYFVLPDGGVYQFTGSIGASTLVGSFDASVHADPSLIYNAQPAVHPAANVSLSVNGNQLTIDPPPGFTGDFQLDVTVTDGAASATRSFDVSAQNQVPVLDPINDRTLNRSVDSFNEVLNASDGDGDSISFSAVVSDVNGVTPATTSFNGSTLTVDPIANFAGTFVVSVTATDGTDSATQSFSVTVTNQVPTLASVPNQAMSLSEDARVLSLGVSDADGDALTYSATVSNVGVGNAAYDFDQLHGLYATQSEINGNYWFNYRGANEKYFRGTDVGWYFIVPNGNVYQFAGSIGASVNVASFDSSFYADPSLLYDAQPVLTPPPDVQVSFNGSQMTIDPADAFSGDFNVEVTISDGIETATRTFDVSVTNQAPVLDAISNRTVARSTDAFQVVLSASDGDGDSLTYSTNIPQVNGVTPATTSFLGNTMTVDPASSFAGTFQVTVTASDGADSVTQTFSVTVTNAAPTLSSVANQTLSLADDTRVLTVTGNDSDGDALTYSAEIASSGANAAYDFDQLHGLHVRQADIDGNYWLNYRGAGEKYMRGTDHGWYYIVPNGDVYQFNGSIGASTLAGSFDSSTYADPSLLYAAEFVVEVPPDVLVSFNGNQLTIDPQNGYLGQFDVTVTVTDGVVTDSTTFSVTIANQAPVLPAIPNQTMARSAGSITLAMNASDADGDSVTYTATVVQQGGGSPAPASVNVNGNQVTVDPLSTFAGVLEVTVVASDGADTDSQTFTVTVTNNAPTLDAIADQTMAADDPALTITLSGNDTDGDSLSYSAQVGGGVASTLYDFDQLHGLYSTAGDIAGDYWLNYRGAAEKYIRGTDHGWYFILPNGDVYQFTGSIGASVQVASFDASVYADPSLLYNAQAPAGPGNGVQINVTGNQLTIDPAANYSGSFYLTVTTDDGAATATRTFQVTVTAP